MHTAFKCTSASTYNGNYRRLTWVGRGRCGEGLCPSHRANFELTSGRPHFENTYGWPMANPHYWGMSAQSCCVFVCSHLTSLTPTPSVAPPPSLKIFPLLPQDSLPFYSRILPARCPAKCRVLPYTGSTWKQQCLFLLYTCPLEHCLQLWNIENNSNEQYCKHLKINHTLLSFFSC